MKLSDMSVMQVSKLLEEREISSVELAAHYLKEIENKDAALGAYITVCGEQVLKAAEKTDKLRKEHDNLHPLAGIPFGVKDNICTKGVRTTCGSKMLKDFVPFYDASGVENLQMCGMVMLGKQNMDEFGMGSSTEHSHFHITKNPHDVSRIPGGSSGGGAAAVAVGLAPVSLGSDTGGSVRQPAAMCGVAGFKPTYGSVSRYGLIAFASSLDQIGVISRDVTDAAYVMTQLMAPDSKDATSVLHPDRWFIQKMKLGVTGMRIALPKEYFGAGVNPAVKASVLSAAKRFEEMGATVEEVSLPMTEAALFAYYIISSAEASSNLARYDGIRYGHRAENYRDMEDLYRRSRTEGFGDEAKRRIMLGTFVLSKEYFDAYYRKAMQVRAAVKKEFSDIFSRYDLILTPTAPCTAWKFGEKSTTPAEMYAEDICTVPASLAGLPAMSLCSGKDENGLPIGMQLIGKPFDEGNILRAGYAYEQGGGI